jgi:hypothetical protein
MSSPASNNEAHSGENFADLKSHQQMYAGYTHLITRGIIGVVVVVVLLGFITGVL